MRPLLLVTGPPGAGKSAVARNLVEQSELSALVEGDLFFSFLRRGAIAPWLPEAHAQNETVVQAAAAAAGRYTRGGYAVVYDGVIGPWFLSDFAAASGLDAFDYVILLPSVERCLTRVARRRGHGFTDEAATRLMHRDFATARIDDRHRFVDPPEGIGPVAAAILEAADAGELRFPRAQ